LSFKKINAKIFAQFVNYDYLYIHNNNHMKNELIVK
jgi:hypothetical protein